MEFEAVEKLANAVLYEGYILYPYRPSSVKNQKRFNFGVLMPPGCGEAAEMQTECIVRGDGRTRIAVKVRFLQPAAGGNWMEACERTVGPLESCLNELCFQPRSHVFEFDAARGRVDLSTREIAPAAFQLAVRISNTTPLAAPPQSREEVLPQSFCSTHTLLAVEGGEFVSLLEPPPEFAEAAAACRNVGTWPILADQPGRRGILLSSPIILYDYAQVAPESPGDLFDGAEIDEILTLRIMTLTDEEKREMRESDERGREILERTESLPEEHFMKLHGALRGLRRAAAGAGPEEPR